MSRFPHRTHAALALVLGALSLPCLASEAKGLVPVAAYVLDGPAYSDVSGLYTAGMRLTGRFSTGIELPADARGYDAQPVLGEFSFSDGRVTLDSGNAIACALRVDTDEAGVPLRVQGYFRELQDRPGQNTIDLAEGGYFGFSVGELAGDPIDDPCGGAVFGSDAAFWIETRLHRSGFEAGSEYPSFWTRSEP